MITEEALKTWLGTLVLATGEAAKQALDALRDWGREPPPEAARELSKLAPDADAEEIIEAVQRAQAAAHNNAERGGVATTVQSGAAVASSASGPATATSGAATAQVTTGGGQGKGRRQP